MNKTGILDLNFIELEIVIPEIKKFFLNNKIEQVKEFDLQTILLIGRFSNLLISIKPGFNFLSISEKAKGRGESSTFCMLLRKYLKNSIVENIHQTPGDRVIHINFHNGYSLICELTGRHGNIFLVDFQNNIMGFHHKSSSKNRDLNVGEVYEPVVFKDSHKNKIREAREELFSDGVISGDIEDYFLSLIKTENLNEKIHNVRSKLGKSLSKLKKVLIKLSFDKKKLKEKLKDQRVGELFLIVASYWPKGNRSLYIDPAPDGGDPVLLEIPLKCKTPYNASQFYFDSCKKGKRGIKIIGKREKEIQNKVEKLEKEIENIPQNLEKYSNIYEQKPKDKKKQQKKSSKYRKFISKDGFDILVGKSALQNHQLTFKTAKGNDLWLHAHNFPGSHVVVCLNNRQLPPETLIDAATLALLYSGAKKNGKGEVMYTSRKYVKPIKGLMGKVTVATSKNIFVTLNEKRLERLFLSNT
jgi:predicted ribosome quality control (RQC) complex YloA/Tae2 family protein